MTQVPAGEAGALRAERAIVELRRGRAVELWDAAGATVLSAVDRCDPQWFEQALAAGQDLRLTLSAERAQALGLAARSEAEPVQFALSPALDWDAVVALALAAPEDLTDLPPTLPAATVSTPMAPAAPARSESTTSGAAASSPPLGAATVRSAADDAAAVEPGAVAALELLVYAQVVPAVLSYRVTLSDAAQRPLLADRLTLERADIASYPQYRAYELRPLTRARVPLAEAEDCEFVVYRERYGDADHVAVIIGQPDLAAPVPVRLHSACFTGDLLASLRCDCGDQLRGAVARMREIGGGVLLYLAQEGRGIGLVNKLRAYGLQQNAGLDTVEADQQLGFGPDQRDFGTACAMLQDLGIRRIRLLTNNPAKLEALNACQIEVVDRLPLLAPVNPHNHGYLRTKRERAGHLIDDLPSAG